MIRHEMKGFRNGGFCMFRYMMDNKQWRNMKAEND
jgi:hypothetical protein